MKKLIKHVFKEHRYPAIAVILLIIIFISVPEMQAREMKQASVARIATIGMAFNRLAEPESAGPPNYILALRRTGGQLASIYSAFSETASKLAILIEGVVSPSSSVAMKKALSGGVLAVGAVEKRGDIALFDIEITPVDQAGNKILPILVLTVAFLLILIVIVFLIRKIKKNVFTKIKN